MIGVGIRIVAIAIAILLVNQLVFSAAACNRALRAVELRMRPVMNGGVPRHETVRIARANIHMLDSVASGCPRDFELYLLRGLNKRVVRQYDGAIADLTAALRIADRPEIYFNRGLIYLETGNPAQAVADLRIAVEFSPKLIYRVDGELRNQILASIESNP